MSDPLSSPLYIRLKEDVASHARRCGRDPSEITIVAVSKTHPWDDLKSLYASGCRDFGENRIQEALIKSADSPKDLRWHFIGPLQKNKVRKAVGQFVCIHSVDSLELAEKIGEVSLEKGVVTTILLEVNTSHETTKQGFSQEALLEAFSSLAAISGIKIEGLMTMAPLTTDEGLIRSCFSKLRELKEKLDKPLPHLSLPHLSMGMSNDWRIAVEEGATLLRIGRALFE